MFRSYLIGAPKLMKARISHSGESKLVVQTSSGGQGPPSTRKKQFDFDDFDRISRNEGLFFTRDDILSDDLIDESTRLGSYSEEKTSPPFVVDNFDWESSKLYRGDASGASLFPKGVFHSDGRLLHPGRKLDSSNDYLFLQDFPSTAGEPDSSPSYLSSESEARPESFFSSTWSSGYTAHSPRSGDDPDLPCEPGLVENYL